MREELQKAQGDLEKLKKQWATHEATKKRNEIRHVEALQPLKTSMSAAVSSHDDELNMVGKEFGRRNMAPPVCSFSLKPLLHLGFILSVELGALYWSYSDKGSLLST